VFEITRLNTVFEIDPGVAYFPAAPRVLMAA